MDIQHYNNTAQQLEAAVPLLEDLSEHLITANTLPIKRFILMFLDEMTVSTDSSLALNKLILTISAYLITYAISLTPDNATRLKKLYVLLYK